MNIQKEKISELLTVEKAGIVKGVIVKNTNLLIFKLESAIHLIVSNSNTLFNSISRNIANSMIRIENNDKRYSKDGIISMDKLCKVE
jgi:hypothetical protein